MAPEELRYLFNRLAVLNEPSGALHAGHEAEAVGNDQTGWTYYSKDGPASTTDGNQTQFYPTLAALEAAHPDYTDNLIINATPQQDKLMNAYASKNYSSPYNLCTNNCADLVVGTMRAGGISVPDGTTWWSFGVVVPNKLTSQLQNQQ